MTNTIDQLAAIPHICGCTQHEIVGTDLRLCLSCREMFKPSEMKKTIPPLSGADRAYLREIERQVAASKRHQQ